MALTRRQFVTRLGALAAAAGMGQADLAKITGAFAHAATWGGTGNKPKVIWVHGAECTGCSTSVLSIFEDARGTAVFGHPTLNDIPTHTALGVIFQGVVSTDPAVTLAGHRTLETAPYGYVDGSLYSVNIADVLIDVIDLEYHETVMTQGGDLAFDYLKDNYVNDSRPFVLVVEGAIQPSAGGGYWSETGDAPWCSIAANGTAGVHEELKFDAVVGTLADRAGCAAVIAVGQCATWGGYPASIGPGLQPKSSGTKNQTGAMGCYDYLLTYVGASAANKVVNVPGCPVNPWWVVLTVVAWLVDATVVLALRTDGPLGILSLSPLLGIKAGAVDDFRRLKAVYPNLLHGKYCPRYPKYAKRVFASKPGDDGCLKQIGCKGLSTMSSCGRHGWNAMQPQNAKATIAKLNATIENLCYSATDGTKIGGNCLTAGGPCMGCTEKGYPDAFTPFVVR